MTSEAGSQESSQLPPESLETCALRMRFQGPGCCAEGPGEWRAGPPAPSELPADPVTEGMVGCPGLSRLQTTEAPVAVMKYLRGREPPAEPSGSAEPPEAHVVVSSPWGGLSHGRVRGDPITTTASSRAAYHPAVETFLLHAHHQHLIPPSPPPPVLLGGWDGAGHSSHLT